MARRKRIAVPPGYRLIFRHSYRTRNGKIVRSRSGRPFPMLVRR
jgi:hypothetical protein